MFSRKNIKEPIISVHHKKGDAEIAEIKNMTEYTGIRQYSNTDLAKILQLEDQ